MIARWRLQLVAEAGVGRLIRAVENKEEADFTRLKDTTHDDR